MVAVFTDHISGGCLLSYYSASISTGREDDIKQNPDPSRICDRRVDFICDQQDSRPVTVTRWYIPFIHMHQGLQDRSLVVPGSFVRWSS